MSVLVGVMESFCLARLNEDRKSTRLNSSHSQISYAVFCLKKKPRHHTLLKSAPAQSPILRQVPPHRVSSSPAPLRPGTRRRAPASQAAQLHCIQRHSTAS